MTIEFVIDEIVLYGFDAAGRHAVGDAVASELARLSRAHAAEWRVRRSLDVTDLDAGSFQTPVRTPADTGAHIARSVFTAVRGRAS